ncbi:CPBP family intramembrane glutamic endopeptidase [Propionibacteriaceae bacterium G1746]|uniref:CPBP family intramembrane glutamic endopeptidase n=1 Tax=Aestuariimicrobium sp. G57 TaxID=3418485 RepID=UPI003C20D5C2
MSRALPARFSLPTTPLPDAPLRRRLGWETGLLLALSLGQSGVYAVLRITERMTRPEPLAQQTSTLNVSATPDRPWLDFIYQTTDAVFLVVPGLMAIFLVTTVLPPRGEGSGALRVMGLDGGRRGFDIGWGFGIAAAIGVPGLFFYLGARALGINTNVAAANLTDTWWTIPVLVVAAFANGFVEEVVMVGYLFTRWAQAGMAMWPVLVVSALVRGSYHLYQGWGGFAGNVLMGLAFGAFFLRTKRVWPLVVAHGLIDVAAFVGYALLAPRVSWL